MSLRLSVTKEDYKFEISTNSDITIDSDLMILCALSYCRLLRVMPSSSEKQNLAKSFIIWYEELEGMQSLDFSYIEPLLNTYKLIHKPSKIFKEAFNIELKENNSGNRYLDIDAPNVDPTSFLVYIIFEFVWKKVNNEDKMKLLDTFSLISAEYLSNGLSMASAVSLPNHLLK